jgi:mannitol/fructose-specific phosphotransferase system IIA component (Ntr-type)
LTRTTIEFDVVADDWRESVRRVGALLVRTGAAEPRYVEAMIRVVEELGPYMVIAPGIALAHARPEDGVLAPGIALVRLATAVEFGSAANDPVDLVFALAAVDSGGHVTALRQLALLLAEARAVETIRGATNVASIESLVAGAAG